MSRTKLVTGVLLFLSCMSAQNQNSFVAQRMAVSVSSILAAGYRAPNVGQTQHSYNIKVSNAPAMTCVTPGTFVIEGSLDGGTTYIPMSVGVLTIGSNIIRAAGYYPIVRGRYLAIDGVNCRADIYYSGTGHQYNNTLPVAAQEGYYTYTYSNAAAGNVDLSMPGTTPNFCPSIYGMYIRAEAANTITITERNFAGLGLLDTILPATALTLGQEINWRPSSVPYVICAAKTAANAVLSSVITLNQSAATAVTYRFIYRMEPRPGSY